MYMTRQGLESDNLISNVPFFAIGTVAFLFIVFTILYFAYMTNEGTSQIEENRKEQTKIFKGLLLISVIVTAIYGGMSGMAYMHGAYDFKKINEMSVTELAQSIYHSPMQSTKITTDTDFTNKIIIYYKFGCSDCEDIYDDLKNNLSPLEKDKDYFFISSRSEIGKELLTRYTVDEVPSAVYIMSNGDFVKKVLYTKDPNKDNPPAKLHKQNLKRIKTLFEEKR